MSGGVNMPVTPLNVYEYVRKYAEHRMLVVAEQPLHVSMLYSKLALEMGGGNMFVCCEVYLLDVYFMLIC